MAKDTEDDKIYQDLCTKYGRDLVDKEFENEYKAQNLGIMKAQKEINQDIVTKGAGGRLLTKAIDDYSRTIETWLKDANETKKAGRHHVGASLIKLGDPTKIAYIALKGIMHNLLISHKTKAPKLATVSLEITKEIENELRYQTTLNSLTANKRAVVLNALSKRRGATYKRAFMRAIEKNNIAENYQEPYQKWSNTNRLQIGAKLIELASLSTGIFKLMLYKRFDDKNPTYYLVINEDVLKSIESNNEFLINMGFVNKPMLIPPCDWTGVLSGGYYIDLKSPIPFIRMPIKKLIKLYNDVSMPLVYNTVNTLQATPWKINRKVLDIVKTMSDWVHIPEELDLPSQKPMDAPIKPVDIDTNEMARKLWRSDMRRYYEFENSRKGKRLSINALIALAEEYKEYDQIYFPYNIDFRGRVYSLTNLSPQGSDLCKGLLLFANGSVVSKDNVKWLAFQGANCYGLDKRPLKERFEWAFNNQELIQKIANDPLNSLEWCQADSPWEFLAWCFDWNGFLNQGYGYKSHIPIAFDASCSGTQHYSAMLRDEAGGFAVNLVPTETKQDIYNLVSNEVIKLAQKDLIGGSDDTEQVDNKGNKYIKLGTKKLAKEWLDFGISRNVTKKCVMTLPYSCKEYGFRDHIYNDTVYPALLKNPNVFSKPTQATAYMASLIWRGVHMVVKKPMDAMKWLQDTSALLTKIKGINGQFVPTYWISPAGFPVYQAYEKEELKRVSTILNGDIIIKTKHEALAEEKEKEENNKLVIRPLIYETKHNSLDIRKQKQGIAPNFVHSMDASHLMLTINRCAEKGITDFAIIHDSFGTNVENAELLFHIIREAFVDMYTNNDVLLDFYHQAKLQIPANQQDGLTKPPKTGNLDLNKIKDSLYAFS